VVEEARRCAESGESKVILTALCGHGHFDMVPYERYPSGDMTDFGLPQERIDAALADLPKERHEKSSGGPGHLFLF
jgi:tryptophan synthase beta chain